MGGIRRVREAVLADDVSGRTDAVGLSGLRSRIINRCEAAVAPDESARVRGRRRGKTLISPARFTPLTAVMTRRES
jgi:hypothetical protein